MQLPIVVLMLLALRRALALDPDLPKKWKEGSASDPVFPRFHNPPEGGVTAWFTMRLTELGEGRQLTDESGLEAAIKDYEDRDQARITIWKKRFK